jgi:glycosyltransferase involved in cell wall biosynthesis
MDLKRISVTILTKNSSLYIKQVLESLRDFGEVVIYDNGSQDDTLDIVRRFSNVSLYQGPFMGFGVTHNYVTSLTKHEWIFSLDSDELVTPELREELVALHIVKSQVAAIPRKNIFNGKWIRSSGWYPDYQYRLYHKETTQFTDTKVHEQVIVKGLSVIKINNFLLHFPYGSITDFLKKMQHYSELFAEENQGKRKSSPCKAVLHGLYAFFKSFFLKMGFKSGYEGFVIASYNAHTAFYKYLKLYEKNKKLIKDRS